MTLNQSQPIAVLLRVLRYMLPLLAAGLLYSEATTAQQNIQTIDYTTREGLSSNSVYRTLIDRRGFLWIATGNGVCRFDGRKFDTYTTSRGLTDNEIIDLFIDSSGVIWAIPFRRTPCYYNVRRDRFENENTDDALNRIELANTHRAQALQFGGMAFANNRRELYVYKNGETTAYKNFLPEKSGLIQRIFEYQPGKMLLFCEDSIRYFDHGKIVKSVPMGMSLIGTECMGSNMYLAQARKITALSINSAGKMENRVEKEFPFDIRIFCCTGKSLAITSVSGNTYLLDRNTLTIRDNVLNEAQVRNVMEDKDGNTWLATMESGLVKVQQKRISSYTGVKEMEQNFNALIKTPGFIVAGTNNGDVYVYDGLYAVKRIALTDGRNIDAWVRRIVQTNKGIFVATQVSSFFFDTKMQRQLASFTGTGNHASKTAALLNDSTLGTGTHSQAWKYNITTGKWTDSITKRVTAMAADAGGRVYIGSNDGFFRWTDDSLIAFGKRYSACNFRVNSIACSPDGIVWVGLGTDSLLAMKDDQLLASFPLGGIIPGNICQSLYCDKAGVLWLGTNRGLNRISYQLRAGKLSISNTYFGVADGLPGDQVNDITIRNDTVYVATSGGISYLPSTLLLPVADIATYVTRVTINGEDEEVSAGYSLPYYKNDISVDFSGVDLTGFIPLFEYNVNDGEWRAATSIRLRLAPGSYKIRIRAIKRDGSPSPQEASVQFTVHAAFWRTTWFRVLVVVVAFGAVIYFLQRRNQLRRRQAVSKAITEKKLAELEMQALMSQINPHFVFNSLNSIKGFIYDQELKEADRYLDKFSDLLRSTLDNAQASVITLKDEIKYLDTYLQLELLRFRGKFIYRLIVEPGVNTESVFVPAMLLQPYVENAIRHGVRHLEDRQGIITIAAAKMEDYLVCTISDNGIGREEALRLRSQKHIEYQSRGMQLSKRRAELYGIEQEIIDLKDEQGNASGTAIVLRIPLSLKP